jgi:hypothetical protein
MSNQFCQIKVLTEAYCASLFRQFDLLADVKHRELDIYFYSGFYRNNLLDFPSTNVSAYASLTE